MALAFQARRLDASELSYLPKFHLLKRLLLSFFSQHCLSLDRPGRFPSTICGSRRHFFWSSMPIDIVSITEQDVSAQVAEQFSGLYYVGS
ncbi:hypothetical protein PsorP6_003668 [Peronosclerospora sorghi]|uniref:Uncharacterized protein n=1 Tax=Peronosclerospora sorghi TaxID=230839 RepID=A0ACC0VMR7_9STRA|nr:hypothetical protein PsorP6_003668 [Peronosclerospora sorghi]